MLTRRSTATKSINAPRVARAGVYHGTKRIFMLNWTIARASPSRQAARPAQKYTRPAERAAVDGVVETVGMFGSRDWDGRVVLASRALCPDELDGASELVLEVVSDNSVEKDTVTLPPRTKRTGIARQN